MNLTIRFFILIFVFSSPQVFGEKRSFLPRNDLSIPVGSKDAKGITEEQYNAILDKAEFVYRPVIAKLGFNLKIERLWKKGVMNAEAEQIGNDWILRMFGGLARYRNMSEEAYTLVLCHELGHHIGGAPKYIKDRIWAANEGQSDYFATLKCARRMWNDVDNNSRLTLLQIPPELKSICDANWKNENDKLVCLRSGSGGLIVTEILAFLRRKPRPKIETPDPTEVKETYDHHSKAQCRLDSFISGAICNMSYLEDVTFESEVSGTCHGLNGDTVGLRPRCWFKPQSDG